MEGNSVIQGLPRLNCFRLSKTYLQPSFHTICGQLVNDKLFWWLLCVFLRFYYPTTRIHRVWYLESAWLEKILSFLSDMLVNNPQVTVGNWTQRWNAPIETRAMQPISYMMAVIWCEHQRSKMCWMYCDWISITLPVQLLSDKAWEYFWELPAVVYQQKGPTIRTFCFRKLLDTLSQ